MHDSLENIGTGLENVGSYSNPLIPHHKYVPPSVSYSLSNHLFSTYNLLPIELISAYSLTSFYASLLSM